jgi:hypothetical protein
LVLKLGGTQDQHEQLLRGELLRNGLPVDMRDDVREWEVRILIENKFLNPTKGRKKGREGKRAKSR